MPLSEWCLLPIFFALAYYSLIRLALPLSQARFDSLSLSLSCGHIKWSYTSHIAILYSRRLPHSRSHRLAHLSHLHPIRASSGGSWPARRPFNSKLNLSPSNDLMLFHSTQAAISSRLVCCLIVVQPFTLARDWHGSRLQLGRPLLLPGPCRHENRHLNHCSKIVCFMYSLLCSPSVCCSVAGAAPREPPLGRNCRIAHHSHPSANPWSAFISTRLPLPVQTDQCAVVNHIALLSA